MPDGSLPDESLPDEAERLHALIGEWLVSGVLIDREDRFPVTGRWRFSPAVDGWGVKGSMSTSIEGMGSFEEEEFIGLDAATGAIHLISMNKFTIRDHVGGWNETGTLITRYESEQEGARTVETIELRFPEPDRIEGQVLEQVDGLTVLETELHLEKVMSGA